MDRREEGCPERTLLDAHHWRICVLPGITKHPALHPDAVRLRARPPCKADVDYAPVRPYPPRLLASETNRGPRFFLR